MSSLTRNPDFSVAIRSLCTEEAANGEEAAAEGEMVAEEPAPIEVTAA